MKNILIENNTRDFNALLNFNDTSLNFPLVKIPFIIHWHLFSYFSSTSPSSKP